MKTKSLILILSVLFFYSSCSDSTTDIEEELSTTNEMLSFVIKKSSNEDYLEEDIVGVIEDGEIKLTMSEEIDATQLIATFTHNGEVVLVGSVTQESGVTANDFSSSLVYTIEAESKDKKQYTVKIDWLEEETAKIPHIYIDTDNGTPIVEKRVYIDTDISIVGGDKYDDFAGRGAIRGRGNSTWGMPKKPYRFKLDDAASLLGLAAERNWVLLHKLYRSELDEQCGSYENWTVVRNAIYSSYDSCGCYTEW